jgi:hypothetical protein
MKKCKIAASEYVSDLVKLLIFFILNFSFLILL